MKEDVGAFFMFYWPLLVIFYPLLKMHNELHDSFSLKFRKTRRELSQMYLCDAFSHLDIILY